MVDRWVMYGLLVLLSSESFLASFVGEKLAALAVIIPLAVLAYKAVVIRLLLSGAYRATTSEVLRRALRPRGHALLFGLLLLLLFASFVRAAQVGTFDYEVAAYHTIKWSSVLVLLFVTVLEGERRGESAPLLRAVTMAFLLYAGVNLLLYLAGVQNDALNAQYLAAREPGLMFRLLGLDVTRVPLPLSGGINTAGLQVASGLALGAGLVRVGVDRGTRRWALVLAVSSLLCILIADSRGGMLGALAGAGAVFAPRALKRQAKWLAWAVPALPLLLIFVLGALSNEPWLGGLSRAGASSVGALSGRPLIWGSILVFLSTFQPVQLVGYGAMGQIGSGVSARYAVLFATDYASPLDAGAHNSILQAILDVGYIGAAIQLLLYWRLLRHFARVGEEPSPLGRWGTIGLGAAVSLLFLGLTGETVSITAPNTLILFLALNVHCLTTQRRQPTVEDSGVQDFRSIGEERHAGPT